MATTTKKCTGVGICYKDDRTVNSEPTLEAAPKYADEFGFAGYNSGYDTTFLRFTTPDFSGSRPVLYFNFRTGYMNYRGDEVELRYALCTSDANYLNYMKTNSDVEDENQIATGTAVFDTVGPGGMSNYIETTTGRAYLTIEGVEIKKNTTYYLILWAATSANAYTGIVPMTVAVGYDNGTVYINDGAGLAAYQPYIDNGESWDLVIPHIDEGTAWSPCS